jgi:alpha-L-fucosidase 2
MSRRAMLQGSAAATLLASLPSMGWATSRTHGQRLWYTRPASVWTEALPIGNGRLGAMVFGGTARERLQLNEDTLYSGAPYDPVNPAARAALPEVQRLIDAGAFAEAEALADKHVMGVPRTQMAYQILGDLLLELPGITDGEGSDYHRELDLDAAVATTRFRAGGTRFRREVLASTIDQVVAVQLVADRPFELLIGLTSPQRETKIDVAGPVVTLTGRNGSRAGIEGALQFTARAQVVASGGTVAQAGDRVRVSGANAVTILVAMATNFRRFDDVSGDPDALTRAVLVRASSRPYARIRADAVAAHRELFRRCDRSRQPTRCESADGPAHPRRRDA